MATLYYNKDGRPLRGSLHPGKEWPHGSRQVIRRAMATMYFNQFARLDVPRRIRRSMARAKMHRVYSIVKQDQLSRGVVGNLPKPLTMYQFLVKFCKEILPW